MEEIVLYGHCPICGTEYYIHVFEKDYKAWKNGTLIQKAFPYLSTEGREMLISGLCTDCQKDFFGEEE